MPPKDLKSDPSEVDRAQGAAFIAWCKETVKMPGFDGGMISRAQAARVLGVSQVAVNRLIGRGFIRARHFPKDPDIESIPIGLDDPFWHRMMGYMSDLVGDPENVGWYQACYVSLDDVVKLWEKGNPKEFSRMNWRVFLPNHNQEPLYKGPHIEEANKRSKRK